MSQIKYISAEADFTNYHENTVAFFTKCETPNRTPDFESHSGSKYWYEGDYVIRESDHWGYGVASCDWFIKGIKKDTCSNWNKGIYTAKCKISEFKIMLAKKVIVNVNGVEHMVEKGNIYLDKKACKKLGLNVTKVGSCYVNFYKGIVIK